MNVRRVLRQLGVVPRWLLGLAIIGVFVAIRHLYLTSMLALSESGLRNIDSVALALRQAIIDIVVVTFVTHKGVLC